MPIPFVLGILLTLAGCVSPRSASLFGLNFSDQATKALIDIECNGLRTIQVGVAVCEEKTPGIAKIEVKIPPTPGRVIFSDGLAKKIVDFNWRKDGFLWWKRIKLERPWAPLEVGELSATFGDVPVAFDIAGELDGVGLIVTRGTVYHRICNDRDIPCSRLIVDYECGGKVKNTGDGQLGSCNRMSGSMARFRVPLKTLGYQIQKGAQINVRSGRSTWTITHIVNDADLANNEFKFTYPNVLTGPDLFSISVYQWEQGVAQRYRTDILIVGYDPRWTGIDNPHWLQSNQSIEFCTPMQADLMQVTDMYNTQKQVTGGCTSMQVNGQLCAFAWDRESGDLTYQCIKNGKEVRWGGT